MEIVRLEAGSSTLFWVSWGLFAAAFHMFSSRVSSVLFRILLSSQLGGSICRFRCSIGGGDYRVDVGGLVVLGPQPQDRTCVLGQRCVWEDSPTTLDGVHIDPNDALMVRATVRSSSPHR